MPAHSGLLASLGPGAIISNLRNVLHESGEASGLGTLGFVAAVNGSRDPEIVLVSNRHVLLAHGAGRGDPIYRPVLSFEKERYAIRADNLESIAEILDEGTEENHRFRYQGEAARDYFVDCATARVAVDRSFGGLRLRRAGRIHPLDIVGGRVVRVRKAGGVNGTSTGRVIDAYAPVEIAGRRRVGNIVIRASGVAFVKPGDSGALLLNDRNEPVGMLWGRSERDPELAYACHLHPVLDRLGVTMLGEVSS
jgi:hypothetical protein